MAQFHTRGTGSQQSNKRWTFDNAADNTKGPLAVRMPLNALTRIKALNALKAKGIAALSSLQVELLTASQAIHIRWHNLLLGIVTTTAAPAVNLFF